MTGVDPLGGLAAHDLAAAQEKAREAARKSVPSQRRPTPASFFLLGVLLVFFLVQVWFSPNRDGLDPLLLYRMGSLHEPSVAAGDFWRLGSYAFLHIGVAHFVLNAFALWVLMRPVELSFGSAAALGLFAAAALAGGCASALHAQLTGDVFLQAAGASGGLFGLLGATGALYFRLRHRLPAAAFRAGMGTLVANLILSAVIGFYAPVDNFAHVGGFIGGGIFAMLVPHPALPRRLWQQPAQWLIIACSFVLAAMEGAAVARAVRPRDRVLHSDGLTAHAPYFLPQAAPGEFAVSTTGLVAKIFREGEAAPTGGPARELGGRRWVEVSMPPPTDGGRWARSLVLIAKSGAGSVGVVVRCPEQSADPGEAKLESPRLALCTGLVDGAAAQLASTLTGAP